MKDIKLTLCNTQITDNSSNCTKQNKRCYHMPYNFINHLRDHVFLNVMNQVGVYFVL